MTSTTPRIITTALLSLAVAAPAASAAPIRDSEGVQTSSLAGTVSPRQDLRGADARPQAVPLSWAVPPVQQTPYTADQLKPISTPVAATDDDPSPFVYIIPAVALVALGATGYAFARTRRSARRSPA